jgi:hypothetical protein
MGKGATAGWYVADFIDHHDLRDNTVLQRGPPQSVS